MRKGAKAMAGLAVVLGALALREMVQRQVDQQQREYGRDYWKLAHPRDLVAWAQRHMASCHIPSGGIGIHVDVYSHQPQAPVVVLVHGMFSYSKTCLSVIHAWYDAGYTVIVPDLNGNGLSGGIKGDFPMNLVVNTIIDTTLWARQRYDGPLFLMGISLGGALTYAVVAAGAPVSAAACMDLFMLDDPASLRKFVQYPAMIDALPILQPLSAVLGWVRIPLGFVRSITNIVAPDEAELLSPWLADPIPARDVSLRTLTSMANTAPATSPERNTTPIIVFNQMRDQILDPSVTLANYLRLSGPKRYVELPNSAHWSFRPEFWQDIVKQADEWFTEHQISTVASRSVNMLQART